MNRNAIAMENVDRKIQPAQTVRLRVASGTKHMTPESSVRVTNQVLAALPLAEWRHVEPHLEWVELPLGATLYEAGVALEHVYFPATAIVSLVSSMKDGASAEVAVVGNEGVVGVCAFMSGAVVHTAGHALRMTADSIACHARQSPIVMQQLLRYTQALFTHMAQTSACNRHHALDQKLCRWLLLNLDRHTGNEMIATHEQIAGILGVRREGVTCSALKVQKAGLIQYRHGRISVLDRAGLEERSCECYAVVRQAYDRLWARPAAQWHGSGRTRRLPVNEVGLRHATA
jgi:CRP-like cAMP-binding protein